MGVMPDNLKMEENTMENLINAMAELLENWKPEYNNEKYPFDKSFDEMMLAVMAWKDAAEEGAK